MRQLVLFIAALTLGHVASGQDLGTEDQLRNGKALYDSKCAHCHGAEGDAVSIATAYLRPTPRDFASGQYKFRTTGSGELPTTEDIKRSIREGMPYTSMPPWEGILSESEIEALAYYLKTFNADFDGPYGNPEVINIPKAPAYNEDNLERGRLVFEANQCADCHGENGRGNGPSALELEDEWGYPIRPADMTKRWTFRASATREDVYRTFTTGLNGTPMPSYQQTIEEADRWALVDYVWSLSRDEPDYSTVVSAVGTAAALDVTQGEALFVDAPKSYLPIVGQLIEPGRSFYPGVNGIEVQVVFNQEEIAFLLSWHDMTAEQDGANHPGLSAPLFDPMATDTTMGAYSDAVALLLPAETPDGLERPYFMLGDAKRAMSIWFADLATDTASVLMGNGSASITDTGEALETYAAYEDGVWKVVLKGKRQTSSGLHFDEAAFTPVTFSVWDGLSQERGNRRGISAWYYVYLAPMEAESAALPMAKWAVIVLLLELALIGIVRWRHHARAA